MPPSSQSLLAAGGFAIVLTTAAPAPAGSSLEHLFATVLTTAAPAGSPLEPIFHEAEAYHQDFYRKNPNAPYSLFNIRGKLKKLGLEK